MGAKRIFVGFDPGGHTKFGWCVLSEPESIDFLEAGVCSSASEALAAVRNAIADVVPSAIGIDAPMYWVSTGDRSADKMIRRALRAAGAQTSTVMAVNSLQGACLAQGAIVARLARQIWSNAPITEAHPKALVILDNRAKKIASTLATKTENERDAAVAAHAARATILRYNGWINIRESESNVHELIQPPFPLYWFPGVTN